MHGETARGRQITITSRAEINQVLSTFLLEDLNQSCSMHGCVGHMKLEIYCDDELIEEFDFDHGTVFCSKKFKDELAYRGISEEKAAFLKKLLLNKGFTLSDMGIEELKK
ncbi:MAG: hypothetical protein L3J71_16995 [Victivallaceae bacterium]|nr:hypothetical protein [Victivallaceae bacterium]